MHETILRHRFFFGTMRKDDASSACAVTFFFTFHTGSAAVFFGGGALKLSIRFRATARTNTEEASGVWTVLVFWPEEVMWWRHTLDVTQ